MTGTKRSSPGSETNTRASKVAKTDASSAKVAKGPKKGTKPVIPTATFKARAMPLHVNLTHTPPTIAEPDTEAVSTATIDPGFVGNLTLIPSSFSTGSYGWKGSKRITVELQNSDAGETKEKVQVMLTINATVVGSKQAKSSDDDEDETKEGEPSDEE